MKNRQQLIRSCNLPNPTAQRQYTVVETFHFGNFSLQLASQNLQVTVAIFTSWVEFIRIFVIISFRDVQYNVNCADICTYFSDTSYSFSARYHADATIIPSSFNPDSACTKVNLKQILKKVATT